MFGGAEREAWHQDILFDPEKDCMHGKGGREQPGMLDEKEV